MNDRLVLAVDGGNSKTDVALVRGDGALLSHVRGPLSSPHHIGLEPSLDLIEGLIGDATRRAGLPAGNGPLAAAAVVLLAGVDLPDEETELAAALDARRWARRSHAGNDTFAVLRAGTERGWGVAVVCGAGINCVGVGPDGRHARFPALGPISGDWGGGYDVGLAALSAAARSEDGRGPRTRLERSVPERFGLATPAQVAEAIHRGRLERAHVRELAPVVFAEAANDAVARGIVARLADEVVALARVALERLELTGTDVEIVLGGGLLSPGHSALIEAIVAGVDEVAPAARVRVNGSPPIVGAALLGLDELGAGNGAQARARAELGAAVASALHPSLEGEIHG